MSIQGAFEMGCGQTVVYDLQAQKPLRTLESIFALGRHDFTHENLSEIYSILCAQNQPIKVPAGFLRNLHFEYIETLATLPQMPTPQDKTIQKMEILRDILSHRVLLTG